MRFKNPGGDLVWLTPLLAIAGLYMAYSSFHAGSRGFAIVYGSLGLFSLLTWFDLKWVAIPLMIYFSVAILGGVLLLWTKGFTWKITTDIVIAGYAVYGFWEWRNRGESK